ncbi:MAG TPA: cupin domain-containing protein [Sphingobacteriaceae bacterium]
MIRSTENTEHYIWGENCEGWHLLKSDSLSVIEEKMPPGSSEKLHFHYRCQQLFYILSGQATFVVEGKVLVLKENQSIHIPEGSKHQISNEGNMDLRFLVVSELKSHGDREEV